jgi:hypothetical protein
MIYRLQSGQNGSKFGTILGSHTLRPAPSPETIYGLAPYGLSSTGPVQNPQTIYGHKIIKKIHA